MPLEQVSEVRSRLVTSRGGKTNSQRFADYKCSYCGKVSEKQVSQAKNKSCGCQKGRLISEAMTGNKRRLKHGMISNSTYKIWAAMIQRCTNPHYRYFKNYGGRGIAVCDRWLNSFEAFFQDMGERPIGLSLDRIDNSRGYFKENCRWANRKMQNRNTRRNRILTIDGVSRCLVEWSEQPSAAKKHTIRHRLREGWPEKEAVFGKAGKK